MKKISLLLFVLAGILGAISLFNQEEDNVVVENSESEVVVKKTAKRTVASVEATDPFLKQINKLSDVEKAQVIEESKNESMGFDDFQNKIAELSKETGWDLVVEKSADGHTHIKNKPVIQDFGNKPVPAFSEEDWVHHEETFINIINDNSEIELTDNDRATLEQWKQD